MRFRLSVSLSILLFVISSIAARAQPTATPAQPALRSPDVIYVPTPQEVVDAMLVLAKVSSSDLVYDLGCGDGRIPVTAAKTYGAHAVGIDIDPARIEEANANVKSATRMTTSSTQPR